MGKRRDYGAVLPLTLEEVKRFIAGIREDKKGCWIWKSARGRAYGRIGLRGERWFAHRIAYELFGRHADEGLAIDHLCGVKSCCNPAHLEAVTNSENTLRGGIPRGKKHYLRKRTHCKHGHPLSGDNLVWAVERGYLKRVCRACRNRRLRESRRRARGAAGVKGGVKEGLKVARYTR